MNRLRPAAALIAAGIASGCSVPTSEIPPLNAETTTESQDSIVQGKFSDEELIKIDVSRAAYPTLPEGVRQASEAAVSLVVTVDPGEVSTDLSTGVSIITGERRLLGSGAIVESEGARYVLSAAHVTGGVADHCADAKLYYQAEAAGNRSREAIVRRQSATEPGQEVWSEEYNGGRDAVLLVPDEASSKPVLASGPAVTVQKDPSFSPGDVLFTVNHQPTVDGQSRGITHLDSPAIFSLIACVQLTGICAS
jgi:hypothetical protein